MYHYSMDLQMKLSEIVMELVETDKLSYDTVKSYFPVAQSDLVYQEFPDSCEIPLIRQLTLYYVDLIQDKKRDAASCVKSFSDIMTIVAAKTTLSVPKELYIKLFEYSIMRLQDEILAMGILAEANTIVNTTEDDILKHQIKRALLAVYLKNPAKLLDQIKLLSEEVKLIDTSKLTERAVTAKGLL